MTLTGQTIIDLFYLSLDSIKPQLNKRVISERDANILKMCYEFEDSTFPIYEDIGKEYGLTGERIRQIHNKSLIKLGNAGRKLDSDTPCVRFIEFLTESIELSEGVDTFLKVINCWKVNLSEFKGEVVIRLFSNLIYRNKKDIKNNMLALKKCKNLEIIEQKELLTRVFKENKTKEKLFNLQNSLLNEVIWFKKKSNWANVNSSNLKPKRQVGNRPEYTSGVFESKKCNRNIQFESGLELNFIMQLEDFPAVKFYVEQPTRIEYNRNGKPYIYTPDFAVFLESNEAFLVEIKNFTGMMDARVHRNIEELINYCELYGFGLLLTDGKNTINKLNTKEYNIEFEKELNFKLKENGGRTIFFEEFISLQNAFNIKWVECLSIVLKNNWSLYPFPFKLTNRNNYHKFREILVKDPPLINQVSLQM